MPVVLKCEQGTDEWFRARLGIPTASEFDKIVTASGRPSAQAEDYLDLCLAEYATGETDEDGFSGFWMDRGKELEPEARLAYQIRTGLKVTQVGLVWRDKKKLASCSPDGLVYKGRRIKKGVEIKCPKGRNHGAYYIGNRCPKKYIPQVQGSMWICGVSEWDFFSYHPQYDDLLVTVKRDPKWMEIFDKLLPPFLDRLVEGRESPRVKQLREQRLAMEAA